MSKATEQIDDDLDDEITPAAPAEDEAEAEELDVETRARQMGWRPKDEFEGDPETWRNAEDFVTRGEENPALLRANLRRLGQKVESLEQNLETQKAYQDMAIQAERKRVEAEFREKQRKAVEDGDVEEYDRLESEKKTRLKEAEPDKPAPPIHPAVTAFKERNDWYGTDEEMTVYADMSSARIQKISPDLGPEANLKKVEVLMKKAFPEKFSNGRGRRTAAPDVESGRNTTPSTPKKRTYENMPPESKTACDRSVKIGLCSKEDFVKNYWDSLE